MSSHSGAGVGGSRPLSRQEVLLLSALLRQDFPGRDALEQQASHASASPIDENGSLRLHPPDRPLAAVERRIPVEAEIDDEDGVTVHILLHVLDGKLNEIEVFREDSGALRRRIDPDALRLMIL
jgi:hypothetical protein